MSVQAWLISCLALVSSACVTTIGPFVSDVRRQGDDLIVERCLIEKMGENLSKGNCKTKTLNVPAGRGNRAPEYLYLPNSKVGEVRLTKRDHVKSGARTSTFSYTAAPGLVFTLNAKFLGDRVVGDAVRVGITLDSFGDDRLTGATGFAMLIDGKPVDAVHFDWASRKRGELTHETLQKIISASWVVRRLQGAKNFEIQFGDHGYALPRHATDKLSDFVTYVQARLPGAVPENKVPGTLSRGEPGV